MAPPLRRPKPSSATSACSPPISALDARDEHGNNDRQPIATVTLEATPRIAEKIAVAQTVGPAVAVAALRSPTTMPSWSAPSPPARCSVPRGPAIRTAEQRMLLRGRRRQPIDTGSTYTVGADVSRFQRRSMPARPAEAAQRRRRSSRRRRAPSSRSRPIRTSRTVRSVRVVRGNNVTVVPVGGSKMTMKSLSYRAFGWRCRRRDGHGSRRGGGPRLGASSPSAPRRRPCTLSVGTGRLVHAGRHR